MKADTNNIDNRTIIIDGKEYPCFRTLAANFDFKDATGKEVTAIAPDSITELTTYLWAVVRGACRRKGVEFPYDNARDMAVYLDESDIIDWNDRMARSMEADVKKKR